jgi:hypothetical protein
MPVIKRLLAIEDNDHKWERIERVLQTQLGASVEIVRAMDQVTGDKHVNDGGWDLVLLDMSLDIRRSAGRPGQGGHDYTGGLKIAGRMYYLKKEVATIVVTGFDAFPSGQSGQNQDVILGLEDIERQARKYLGNHLVAIFRYGPTGWEAALAAHLKEFIDS